YSYASPGAGSAAHVYGETLNAEAGIKLLHVPYKGEAAMVNDLLGGSVSAAFTSATVLVQQAAAGKLRLLATTGTRRMALFPNVSTFSESGYSGFDSGGWVGLLVPAGTPKEVIARLAAETQRILREPDISARLTELGYAPRSASPEEFGAIMKADYMVWGQRIRNANVKLD
ncbi:MAG: tripartite tricarboxylate transporter substrate-binding protein, partial [Longimicrobiales bacterium]